LTASFLVVIVDAVDQAVANPIHERVSKYSASMRWMISTFSYDTGYSLDAASRSAAARASSRSV